MTEAIFGLVGVLVGGFLNGGVSWLADRRTRTSEGRVAARLVSSEIQLNNIHLRRAIEREQGSYVSSSVRDSDWEKHRATLALLLEDQAWSCIEHYYLVLEQLVELTKAQDSLGEDLNEESIGFMSTAYERGVEGRHALSAYAGKEVTIVIDRSEKQRVGSDARHSA